MREKMMLALLIASLSAWLVMVFRLRHTPRCTDSLTGVFSAEYFHRRVGRWMEHKREIHLVMIELCHLKKVNRICGMRCGDQLLCETAQMLCGISQWNQVFRVIGRRFVIVTHNIVEYERALHAVRMHFVQPAKVDGKEISLPATICGITDAARLGTSETALDYIDYLASLVPDGAENMIVQDDDQTLKGFRYKQEIESFLEKALKQDLFEVQYQPVYSLEKGGYVALEALSRLHHPALGTVAPDVFIALAEKNDQMSQLGFLQMRRICRFVKENPALRESVCNIKINLSPMELMKNGHVDRLIGIIREYELPTSFFQFEITETAAMEYSEQMRLITAKLTQAGIGLCLDDFGSGYANLNTVLKLPFNAIKLDKSLLSGIEEDNRVAAFYRNIVSALQNMGYLVIAEGVETAKEFELVSRWGVDMIQGYYFARSLKVEEVISMMTGSEKKAEPMTSYMV